MGRVDELEKKLKGDNDKEFVATLAIGSFILGLATPFVAFSDSSGGLLDILSTFGSMILIPLGLFSAIASVYAIQADPQEFVDAYKWDYPQREEIEILEMAYKKAHEYQNEAFKNALTAWLGLGFYLGLLEIG
ncbi:hypothetical protein, partial [Thermococcus sp.]|uniref:hypothetical protein n=1 Tax=Thermococcus sp. TaxID=35749 RepID=UPI0025D6E563